MKTSVDEYELLMNKLHEVHMSGSRWQELQSEHWGWLNSRTSTV